MHSYKITNAQFSQGTERLVQLQHTFDQPFALLAYICGFTSDSSSDLRFHTENKWKEKRDFLISQGDNDVKSWVLYCGNQVISDVCDNNDVRFSVERNELRLVCLFNDR